MNDFEDVVNRHYNEEERLQKIKDNQPIIQSFWQAMIGKIQWLLSQDIRFYVFDIDVDAGQMWAGLKTCCNRDVEITPEIRQEITEAIVNRTIFKHIIWEL